MTDLPALRPARDDASPLDRRMAEPLATLAKTRAIPRLWQRDAALFSEDATVQKSVRNRLGWLFAVPAMREETERLTVLARVVERQGYDRVLVIGMGGSSLWPEVIGKHLRGRRGLPIRVADSTHPEAVADILTWCAAGKALVVVATKSGGTIETMSMYRALRPNHDDGQHYVAITDAGSSLETLAKAEGFRDTFLNPPDIGGRFSAGSLFGLVPAVLAGVVLQDSLRRIDEMLEACRDEDPALNPGAHLGAFLAAAQETGRWQIRLALGRDVRGFGAWIEQLVAESTGKQGTGVLPFLGGVEGEGAALAAKLEHAVVCGLTTFANPDEDFLTRATAAGVPMQAQVMPETADLWTEVVRWEMATAVCGLLLGINPFDEPDVTSAKQATQALLSGTAQPIEAPRKVEVATLAELTAALQPELASLGADEYLGVLCYLAPTGQALQRLESLRQNLQARTAAAVTVQVGPRYLHSTGQFHKGGPAKGRFVVVHDLDREDLVDCPIPGEAFSFLGLARAQCQGDIAVLHSRGKAVTVAVLTPGRTVVA